MGITALKATVGDVPVDGNDKIIALLNEMIKAEEEFEKVWKEYL